MATLPNIFVSNLSQYQLCLVSASINIQRAAPPTGSTQNPWGSPTCITYSSRTHYIVALSLLVLILSQHEQRNAGRYTPHGRSRLCRCRCSHGARAVVSLWVLCGLGVAGWLRANLHRSTVSVFQYIWYKFSNINDNDIGYIRVHIN